MKRFIFSTLLLSLLFSSSTSFADGIIIYCIGASDTTACPNGIKFGSNAYVSFPLQSYINFESSGYYANVDADVDYNNDISVFFPTDPHPVACVGHIRNNEKTITYYPGKKTCAAFCATPTQPGC